MRRNRFAGVVLAFLILFLFIGSTVPVYAGDSSKASKKVRVGYFLSPSYQEGGEGKYKSGRGYEYLQKIAGYTGWTYEYVYGDFFELLQELIDGDIDIMGGIYYTEDRAELISYGRYEQGRESLFLYVTDLNSEIRADDVSTIIGKKIGVIAGTSQEECWRNWCEQNEVNCEIVEFTNHEDRQQALNDGTIDAATGSLISNSVEQNSSWRSVFSFGDAEYYFAINKARPDLLNELNEAQSKILIEDPYYNVDLIKRNTPSGVLSRSQLDNDEVAWIEQKNDPIKVGCLTGYLPISDDDGEGGVRGVLPDVLSAIEDTFQVFNVKFEIEPYTNSENMIRDLKDGVIDVAAPIYSDYWYADREGISLTNSFMSTTMLLLQKGSYSSEKTKRIGIDAQSAIQRVYAVIYYPDSEIVAYPSMEAVTNALVKGEIDSGLSTACCYHINAILYKGLGELNRSTLPNDVSIAMAVSKENPELMALINRGISSIGDMVVYDSLASNSDVEKKVTIMDYVAANPRETIVTVCVIIALAVLIIASLIIVAVRLKKANVRASTDPMTGLLNKASMREIAKEEIKRGGALFMIDIDNFKSINDLLGHEMGDTVINSFAGSLQKIFRSGDLISRFGGDEFIVFLPGTEITEELIRKKVELMQAAIKTCEDDAGIKNAIDWAVSVGVLMIKADANNSYTDAFRMVDEALYTSKKNGKKTYTVAQYK